VTQHVGLGLDLVDVSRVTRMVERHGERVLRRLLTDAEQEYCLAQAVPARHIAARLAAKEAAYKALSRDEHPGWIGWLEFEVCRAADGRPSLAFHGRARAVADRMGVRTAACSLTHTNTTAGAIVVID
jgi:holo-[acyl-carrier protein] synthase